MRGIKAARAANKRYCGCLTPEYVALVACTMRKNTLVDAEGNLIPTGEAADVPVAAVKGMLRYHGLSDHGSPVAEAMSLLKQYLFREVAAAVLRRVELLDEDTGECRVIPGRAARVVCVKPEWFGSWAPVEQRERYEAAAGGRGRVTTEAEQRLAEQVAADYRLGGRGADGQFFSLNQGIRGDTAGYDDDDHGWYIVGTDGRVYFQATFADFMAN
jgi:hypothetical protein